MLEWLIRGHFRHLHFKAFPTVQRTPQGEVFWPLQLSSEVARAPEDSKFPLLGVWVSSSHLPQSGVATLVMPFFFSFPFLVDFLKEKLVRFHHLLNIIEVWLVVIGKCLNRSVSTPWTKLQHVCWEFIKLFLGKIIYI